MRYNTSTHNWDILSNGSGAIYWWNISTTDHYVAGNFNGDGIDELLAISKQGGWSHTMSFINNQWVWQKGNAGNALIGGFPISVSNKYTIRDTYYRRFLKAFEPGGWWAILRYSFANLKLPNGSFRCLSKCKRYAVNFCKISVSF